jgi:hypothetical protein
MAGQEDKTGDNENITRITSEVIHMKTQYLIAICLLATLALGVSPVGATLLTYLGQFFGLSMVVQAAVSPTWSDIDYGNGTQASLSGNPVSIDVVAGNTIRLIGDITVNTDADVSNSTINVTFSQGSQMSGSEAQNVVIGLNGGDFPVNCTVQGQNLECLLTGQEAGVQSIMKGNNYLGIAYMVNPRFSGSMNLAVVIN